MSGVSGQDAAAGCRCFRRRLATSRGIVELYAPAPFSLVETLSVDPGIGVFWRYKDGYRQKEVLLKAAAASASYVTVAATRDVIVGYILLCRRQEKVLAAGMPSTYELSIEVARGWRQLGIAHGLFEATFADLVWDGRIVVSKGFTWHWDTEFSRLTLWQYRRMVVRLHAAYGFLEFATDDPDIRASEANIMMARIGAAVAGDLPPSAYWAIDRGEWPAAWG